MARRPDPAKTRLWSDRLKRFADCTESPRRGGCDAST